MSTDPRPWRSEAPVSVVSLVERWICGPGDLPSARWTSSLLSEVARLLYAGINEREQILLETIRTDLLGARGGRP